MGINKKPKNTAFEQEVLFQSRADVLFEVIDHDKIWEVGQEVLDLQALTFLHNFNCRLNGFVVLNDKNRNLEPKRLA
jgi:hypothetical protein